MILSPSIEIKTKHLTLSPVEDLHIDDISEHFTNEVTRYMPLTHKGIDRI
jgi:hypothetical protein